MPSSSTAQPRIVRLIRSLLGRMQNEECRMKDRTTSRRGTPPPPLHSAFFILHSALDQVTTPPSGLRLVLLYGTRTPRTNTSSIRRPTGGSKPVAPLIVITSS